MDSTTFLWALMEWRAYSVCRNKNTNCHWWQPHSNGVKLFNLNSDKSVFRSFFTAAPYIGVRRARPRSYLNLAKYVEGGGGSGGAPQCYGGLTLHRCTHRASSPADLEMAINIAGAMIKSTDYDIRNLFIWVDLSQFYSENTQRHWKNSRPC